MTYLQTRNKLKQLGFIFSHPKINPNWGTHAAEPYNVGKDHFYPIYRDVFIGKAKGGYYVTSHIHGNMRQYRCRNTYQRRIANIYGGGSTLQEAIREFCTNFISRTYNTQK